MHGEDTLKIALDSWVLSSRFRYQGTYVYAQSLIAEFKKIASLRPEIEFCLFTAPNNSNDAGKIEPGKRFERAMSPLLNHDRLWRLGGVGRAAARAGADLIFTPTSSSFPTGGIPVVCTIHDVTPVLMPSHSRKVNLLQRSILWFSSKRARTIITVSQCSRNDLLNRYGLPESKVKVVYLGYDKALFNDAAPDPVFLEGLRSRLGVQRPYILHHGMIQPRKNLERLIEAYRLLLSHNPNLELDLVLAGALGWNYAEIVKAAHNNSSHRSRVLLPGALDGGDLAMLIKGASLVVIPSLYEGFCLPMIEAMACDVPVIAANGSCLPEVSGGALKYFDPLSIEDMADCMQQALEDEGLRKALTLNGKKRAAVFDWTRCAEETLAVLEKANGS